TFLRDIKFLNSYYFQTLDKSPYRPPKHQPHYIALECSSSYACKFSKFSLPEHLTPTFHPTLQLHAL
ncbi:MAG: hypothetical protein O3A15_08085, partial [Proteobacteria bacterium]|nr:hypothetical protein [Pseudomonadota bacterium]